MNRNKLFLPLTSIFFVALLGGCKSSDQKSATLLKFNLQNGKSYAYKMAMDMNSEAQGQKIKTAMNFDYDLSVTGDSAGVKTLNTAYRRIAMNMTLPNGEMSFDSDKPADSIADLQKNPMGVMNRIFGAMVGKSFTMKVSPEGKVIAITGLNEMGDAMVNSIGMDDAAKMRARQMFDQQFNEENMKQTFSQAFDIFPNKEVKVGDKWEKTLTMNGAMRADAKTVYTVKDIKEDEVTLDAASDIDMAGNKIKQTGTMQIDPNTGLVTKANLEQTMTGTVNGTTTVKITGSKK